MGPFIPHSDLDRKAKVIAFTWGIVAIVATSSEEVCLNKKEQSCFKPVPYSIPQETKALLP